MSISYDFMMKVKILDDSVFFMLTSQIVHIFVPLIVTCFFTVPLVRVGKVCSASSALQQILVTQGEISVCLAGYETFNVLCFTSARF